jgi:hypothetical protein
MEHPNPDDRSRDRRFADVRHLFERWARLGGPAGEAAAPDGPPAAPGAPRDRPGERWPEVLQERFLAGLVAGEDLGRRAERQNQAVARQREYEREVWLDGQLAAAQGHLRDGRRLAAHRALSAARRALEPYWWPWA